MFALAAGFAVALSGCTVPATVEDPATAGGTVEPGTVATSTAPETSPAPAPETTTPTPSPSPTQTPDPTPTPNETPARTLAAEETAPAGTALALLETIEIKGRAPKTGYDRDQFGSGWTDIDHNGCDTRIICIFLTPIMSTSWQMWA